MINYTQLVVDVESGVENPLRAYMKLMELKKSIDKAIDYIKDYAINEAAKHEKGSVIDGRTITYNKGRRMFDFKKITPWVEKKNELQDIESFYKNAWELHQSKMGGFELVDMDSGEVSVLPEVTYSSDYITIK